MIENLNSKALPFALKEVFFDLYRKCEQKIKKTLN
ncbi:hypothetical protein LRU_02319 [Ligilactobacillus ruminis SPM0211]|uniref:Uncharacterized protein n=1 Tax=Ligilactobacillus ruminis SPM0211 TaxID=1040964 RepID=F7R3Q8_9LACO|nr:hypothetical protein LRU_02319 [Ligilactobacillus ruminis SPM0211]